MSTKDGETHKDVGPDNPEDDNNSKNNDNTTQVKDNETPAGTPPNETSTVEGATQEKTDKSEDPNDTASEGLQAVKGTANEKTTEIEVPGSKSVEQPKARSSGRDRQPTEKGKALTLQLRQKAFRTAIFNWKRTATDIEVRVAEATSTDSLRALRPVAEKAISAASQAYAELEKVDPDTETHFEQLDSLQEQYAKIGTLIADRHKEINMETRSVRSGTSRSSRKSSNAGRSSSKGSVRSSNASLRAKAASDAASLQVKLRTIQEENAKKLEITKLTGELEEIQAKRELEAAQATIKAIDDGEDKERRSEILFLDERDANPVDMVERYLNSFEVPGATLPQDNSKEQIPETIGFPSVEAKELKPQSPKTRETDLIAAMEGFTEQVTLSRLPPPEPEIFRGDPLRYPVWKAAFQTLIERKRVPPEEKLFYLTKYLGDKPLDAVKGYLLAAGDEQAYIQAKRVLDRRYGDSFLVANAFRKQLSEWPKIASRDGPGLQSFTDFLNQCLTAMRTIDGLKILDDSQENQKLVGKLPDWMVHRWTRIVAEHRQRCGKFPEFEIFVHFLEKETLVANDPVFATISSNTPKKRSYAQDEKKGRCLSTQKPEKSEKTEISQGVARQNFGKPEKDKAEMRCSFCDRTSHNLDVCRTFMDKPYEEKKDFVQKKGLCFGCLARGHMAKGCKNRKKCRKCEKLHPTAFHRDVPAVQSAETVISHLVESDSSCKSTMIVPVWVYHERDMGNKKLVYAMLDTQSDTTFVSEKTCSDLGVTGISTCLMLSTMSSTNERIPSERITGLRICGFTEREDIKLPTVYTREEIPVNRNHIPTAKTASCWAHLAPISGNLPQSALDIDIGLLIGYNCSRALTPLEVIVGGCLEPYAQRTPVGWSVVGSTEGGSADEFGGICHRLVTSETCKGAERSKSTLSFRPGIKEVMCPQQLIRTLESDFSENLKGKPFSIEDTRFLKILEDGVRIRSDGHYEMPLPMREVPSLPNNFKTALQRLKKLQPRLEKDERFREHYVTFMANMIEQGYVEPASKNSTGEVWYIPHHGVYHPRKPNKIRVVFDASAVFQGVSLNKRLLQGPDLTNNLIGVLCRFRQQPVAVMCDVEQMFYQFGVTKEYRDYLRFLWWKNGDTNDEIMEYRMKVHLFGATSSPGCANYGLKKLAEEAEETYGRDVTSFLRQNFYVDDGLVSLPGVTETISLLKRTVSACASRGLRLHKFVSNVPES